MRCSATIGTPRRATLRSEEHTSELQSQSNLVCRLLLEKKKHTTDPATRPLSLAGDGLARPDAHCTAHSHPISHFPKFLALLLRVPSRLHPDGIIDLQCL